MSIYYFTFGLKYASEKHPSGLPAHPDGYVVVNAEDEFFARETMRHYYGNHWAEVYEEKPESDTYPMGELFSL